MQFISGGPDVPEELIRAHQEGKVIFFCGAGISRNADLPLFEELVDKIFACCGVNKSKSEQDCCEKKQYDTVLDLLERRFDSGRKGVREKLWEILNIRKTLSDNKLATHKALLALARDENNVLRLVTTNYDRLFHIAFKRENKSVFEFNTYQAPFLPIPKKSRWNGLVFLHGLLPSKKEKVKELNRLVLTSGDFGLAYLNERWASRFISELFENYIVCFVGYSINDPVLRYMMDAISADRLMGEKTNEVWAFAVKNKKKDCDEWKDKGATPIYCDNYDKLHETIQEWARVYSDGVEGKSAMIIRYAHQAPQKSTKEDNYVNKVLWAISDPDGGPAETFSKLNPSPSLDWLFEVFSQTTLVAEQLINLGLLPFQEIEKEKKKKFSLIYRIPPYDKSTPMALVLRKEHLNPVDPVMIHLGEWLCHHLGEARLLLWFAAQGDYINSRLKHQIQERLRSDSNIPSPMKFLWELLLRGDVCTPRIQPYLSYELEDVISSFSEDDLLASQVRQLREHLRPMLAINEKFDWGDLESECETQAVDDFVHVEIVLSTEGAIDVIRDLSDEEMGKILSSDFLRLYDSILHEILSILKRIGRNVDIRDPSVLTMPSISKHEQNRGYTDWVVIIELLRDSWLQMNQTNPDEAAEIIRKWHEAPFRTFKRLCLFGAANSKVLQPEEWLKWLEKDNLLWASDMKREVCRLIEQRGSSFSKIEYLRALERVIIKGPESEEEKRNEFAIWLRLKKLQNSGACLSNLAMSKIQSLEEQNPSFQLSSDFREEFSSWFSISSFKDDFIDSSNEQIEAVPMNSEGMALWIQDFDKKLPSDSYIQIWRLACRQNASLCLEVLSQESIRSVNAWKYALREWSEGVHIEKKKFDDIKTKLVPALNSLPEEVFSSLIGEIAYWMRRVSQDSMNCELRAHYLAFCQRTIELETFELKNVEFTDDPVTYALNTPIGDVTQVLMNVLFSKDRSDGSSIPPEIVSLFNKILDSDKTFFASARILLMSQLVPLFRLDPQWAKEKLIPLLDWCKSKNCCEVAGCWQAFLWNARLYLPLIDEIKLLLLETLSHYEELQQRKILLLRFLTFILLEGPKKLFEGYDVQNKLMSLPKEAMPSVIRFITNFYESINDEQKLSYWDSRIGYFWRTFWPKDRKFKSEELSKSLVELMLVSNKSFKSAYDLFNASLQPFKYADQEIETLVQKGLCESYPKESWDVLRKILKSPEYVIDPKIVREAFERIASAEPKLKHNKVFKKMQQKY